MDKIFFMMMFDLFFKQIDQDPSVGTKVFELSFEEGQKNVVKSSVLDQIQVQDSQLSISDQFGYVQTFIVESYDDITLNLSKEQSSISFSFTTKDNKEISLSIDCKKWMINTHPFVTAVLIDSDPEKLDLESQPEFFKIDLVNSKAFYEVENKLRIRFNERTYQIDSNGEHYAFIASNEDGLFLSLTEV